MAAPAAGLTVAGNTTAAVVYFASLTPICVLAQWLLQCHRENNRAKRDSAVADIAWICSRHPEADPAAKALLAYEAIKTGCIDSSDLAAYLATNTRRDAAN